MPLLYSHHPQYHKPGQSSKTTMQPFNSYNQPVSCSALFSSSSSDYAQQWWLNQYSYAPEATGSVPRLNALEVLPAFHHGVDLTPSSIQGVVADVPPSPTDLSSNASESGPSPGPDFVHAVCNAPLVAPVPLPYHSPTFLQFDLPDDDEDLSHPPYVSRPHKRKRESDDEDETSHQVIIKRQATPSSWVRRRSNWATAPQSHSTSHSHLRGWAVPTGFGGNSIPG